MEIDEHAYSGRLKTLRKDKDKTIAEMSIDINLSASAISNYERGLRSPDAETLIKLSQYFGCTADYLLGLSEYRNKEQRKKLETGVDLLYKKITDLHLVLDKDTGTSFYDILNGIISHEEFKSLMGIINYYLNHDENAYIRYADKVAELMKNEAIKTAFTPEVFEEINEKDICRKFIEIIKYLRDNPPPTYYKIEKKEDGSILIKENNESN